MSGSPSTRRIAPTYLGAVLALLLSLILAPAVLAQLAGPPASPTVRAELNTRQVTPGGQHVLAVVVDIPDGFHAQSANPHDDNLIAFAVTLQATEGVMPLPVIYPAGFDKTFAALGTLNVYEGRVIAYVPLSIATNLTVGSEIRIQGRVRAQLCDDQFCYPPEEIPFSFVAPVTAPGTSVMSAHPELFAGFDWGEFAPLGAGQLTAAPAQPAFSEDVLGVRVTFSTDTYIFTFGMALLVGIVFNIMPCVLPVLPLKAFAFYEAAAKSRSRSLLLGAVFALGMIGAFALLGALIAVFSFKWGQLFQYPWFVWGMAALLLVMTASMWGMFSMNLPSAVYALEPRHDTIPGNLFFGGFTALLATPCTAPVFPSLMLWSVAQPPLIAIALFATVGLGMAIPYLVLSAYPELARRLPRSGPWSVLVKQFLGFFIFGTAVWLVAQRYMPDGTFMYALLPVAIIASLFLIVRTLQLTRKIPGVATAAAIAVVLTGATAWATRVMSYQPLEWIAYSTPAMAEARAAGRIVVVKFTANWCTNCHVVERTVFADREVLGVISSRRIAPIKVDITYSGAPGSELLRQLSPAGGIPLTAVYLPGQEQPILLRSIYPPQALLDAVGP